MDQNDRNRDLGLGASGGAMGESDRGDNFGTGMTGSAGSANTPSFGDEPALRGTGMGSAGNPGSSSRPMQGSERGESQLNDVREAASERMEGMRNRVENQLDDGMRTAADRMEGIAQKLDHVADERMSGEGIRGRAGDAAHNVADRIENTAEYLRDADAEELLNRLEDQVRQRPLEMLLAGVATGWLVGKIIR
jgi:ElaB/YqjD/DUF883 family membrane-anchored ribosome-binding protein